ncbi:unnamed protein product [Didymodactylos carnosus]|uniref:cholesterol 7-desaturase n=1 Tax=Didymodactylos carnosus TaxID=1234261 RepID=A0A814DUV0_9BILA|nr:unnamed protein product [Didymodactylos carnosus]CAF0959966.1 unnamed protein product [Didymodactylos carnosus]CAF3719962.1 unnamed protein product [Didymodactylos carnosus]CAF3734664.1 unnamed protein product [Didymodactylos carnosus]
MITSLVWWVAKSITQSIDLTKLLFTLVLLIPPLLYYKYYRIFKFFLFEQKQKVTKGNRSRGKCPPFFPNGWYWLFNACDLKVGDVQSISYCGRDIVLYRGKNGQPYVLEAYCAHMGANLGIGGHVKYDTCIECPFHGWTFDGETGYCILSKDGTRRTVDQYSYIDIQTCRPHPDIAGKYLEKVLDQKEVKIKKYVCREVNGAILAWYHSNDDLREKPLYDPFDLESAVKKENMEGADIRHFDYLHESILDYVPFVKFRWSMITQCATNSNLREIMKHEHPQVQKYKSYILDTYITDDNRPYINVISLDCYLRFFSKYEMFLFNATGLQLGPALVYLFLWSPYFLATFFQTVTPMEKFNQRVMHRIYTNYAIPYWLSALALMGEVKQLFSDMNIWNNKIFGAKLNYNMKMEADKYLQSWRNWYAQFYEGCHEYEKNIESLSW